MRRRRESAHAFGSSRYVRDSGARQGGADDTAIGEHDRRPIWNSLPNRLGGECSLVARHDGLHLGVHHRGQGTETSEDDGKPRQRRANRIARPALIGAVSIGVKQADALALDARGLHGLARDRSRIMRGREKRRDAALAQEPDSGGWIGWLMRLSASDEAPPLRTGDRAACRGATVCRRPRLGRPGTCWG